MIRNLSVRERWWVLVEREGEGRAGMPRALARPRTAVGAGAGVTEPGCWWGLPRGVGAALGCRGAEQTMLHGSRGGLCVTRAWHVAPPSASATVPVSNLYVTCNKKPALYLLASQFLICDKKLAKNAGCSFYR